MNKYTVIIPDYFKDRDFVAVKLSQYLRPKDVLLNPNKNTLLKSVCKVLNCDHMTSFKRNDGMCPIVAFWDGVDPMVKRAICTHLKAKVCVRVIRIDDEENITWMKRNANNAAVSRLS